MNSISRRGALGTLLLLLATASCGYSSGLRAPEGYQSVGVAIFANDSKVPDLERDLHLYVSTSVRDAVEAPITSPELADVLVEGRILGFAHFGGIRGPNNELLETGVSISVESWLTDRKTGERLGEPVYSGQTVGYTTIEFGGEERSKDRALAYLAEGLVLELFARHSH